MSEISIINIKRTHYLEDINGDSRQGHFTRFEIETTALGANSESILKYTQEHLFQTTSTWHSRESYIAKRIQYKKLYGLDCPVMGFGHVYYTIDQLDNSKWAITIYRPGVDWIYYKKNLEL